MDNHHTVYNPVNDEFSFHGREDLKYKKWGFTKAKILTPGHSHRGVRMFKYLGEIETEYANIVESLSRGQDGFES